MHSSAGEIQFIEDFALARDRQQALENLVPGSEDYFFYNCLHLQHTQRLDEVEKLLKRWVKQHGKTQRVRQIQHRQALLSYETNPKQTLAYLRNHLNLHFNHQRQQLNRKPNLPTELQADQISQERFSRLAFKRSSNLSAFRDSALDWLVAKKLNPTQRRHLLERLRRPDYANLPELITKDLRHKGSRGFGSLGIHKLLLPNQLDACVEAFPELSNQTSFVDAYVSKLRPNNDVDWQQDPEVLAEYLDRLWGFVSGLKPVHNSLKVHVLYHKLAHDRATGTYNKRMLNEYLAIPRSVGYLPRTFRESPEATRYSANLGQDFNNVTQLPAVGNDEPLVRDYLLHFLVNEKNYRSYQPFVEESYLKQLFAEAKIVHGKGDAEQYYSLLSPEKYRALRDRVDLEFAPENQTVFQADEPVAVDLYVKNVETLLVKVYEMNTRNYYQRFQREVNTDVNLDGLVANEESTQTYDDPPLRRVRRHFEFPQLSKPGTYVVDFIGNGQSSRVVVRKGRLKFIERATAAGHIFNVLDEKLALQNNASIWLAGHEYHADEKGDIAVPFSTEPKREAVILLAAGRASLHFFDHRAEDFVFDAGFYMDREALISNQQATVLVRPSLKLNGEPVSLKSLTDVRLKITSVDHDGTKATQEVADFKLFEDRESEHTFKVPQRVASLTIQVVASHDVHSTGETASVVASESFNLNGIERSDKIDDLYFSRVGDSYQVELLGRTGEPKANRPVQLRIYHRDFDFDVRVSLQTDENGRIRLGELTDIASLVATSPSGQRHTWQPQLDAYTYSRTIHAAVGASIQIPYLGVADKPQRNEFSLLEQRGRTFTADQFQHLAIQDGFLVVKGLAAGDYDLWIKQTNQHVRIRVAAGKQTERSVLGGYRHLELRNAKPLHITSVTTGEDTVVVQLGNSSRFARVHVMASRFEPEHDAFALLARVRDAEPGYQKSRDLKSFYLAGRNIGDEYRYILDRRFAEKFPGNMLERPSLLLNPWDIRATETGEQQAAAGQAFGASSEPADASMVDGEATEEESADARGFRCYDFLNQQSMVLANLVPDENGVITIDRERLGAHQQLQIVAVDPLATSRRHVTLRQGKNSFRDLRLIVGLDPQKHFTQQKQISIFDKGDEFALRDITTSKFVAYDSLEGVYNLYTTLSDNANLAAFDFVLRWPEMDVKEKADKYSEFACHELNFFIYKKDPEFFNSVVQPYLANKLHKTFLDEWLLGRDLQRFVEPWNYTRLNIVERILLGQQMGGEQPFAERHTAELFELLPPNVERWNGLFQTALAGQALESKDRFGVGGKALMQNRELRASRSQAFAAPSAEMAFDMDRAEATSAPQKAASLGKMLKQRRGGRRPDAIKLDDGLGVAEGYAESDFFEDTSEAARGRFFRKLDKTKEWVENNYYRLPIQQQNANLVQVNAFWNDFAHYQGDEGFFSSSVAEATHSFTEMMFALSVLDLPFQAADHDVDFENSAMTLKAKTPLIIVHEQIREVDAPQEDSTPILVSQDFYRHGERHRQVAGEQVDNFVTDEFLVHTLYGSQVVVTNTSSTRQQVDVLLQVPVGAIGALNSRTTRSVHLELAPYRTQTLDYHFYFPTAGQFEHFPVHVAKNELLLASASARQFNVVAEPSQMDTESWQYVSQYGTDEQVEAYLDTHNVQNIDLTKIAFRMRDKRFFENTLSLLNKRHAFDQTIWSYGIHHNDRQTMEQYLQHRDDFLRQCGVYLQSPLVTIDPVIRHSYEHMDYKPLVNARAHQLGRKRQILNDRFYGQYHRLMNVLSQRGELNSNDLMSVTYYLLLQDRVAEAMEYFGRVKPGELETSLQYDYFAAYLDCYSLEPQRAASIAAKYENFPVPRWQEAFASIQSMLDEVAGEKAQIVNDDDLAQQQNQLAAAEPNFEFSIESKQIVLNYQNVDSAVINFYLMDLELLFSRNPFAQESSDHFALIQPNHSQQVELSTDQSVHRVDLPTTLDSNNVLVEVVSGGKTKTETYYANSLNVRVNENYGQVRVTSDDKPVPTAYVKVYAKMRNGQIRFYKDGYTDLRGKFNYVSLNTNEIDNVERFSLLIMSEEHGAVVHEAGPPKR